MQSFQQETEELFRILLMALLVSREYTILLDSDKGTYAHTRKPRKTSDSIVYKFRSKVLSILFEFAAFKSQSKLFNRWCLINNFEFSHEHDP